MQRSTHTPFESMTVVMSSEHEYELVRRAQDGDNNAFRELVVLNQRQIFHACVAIVRSTADAEDLTQEVFIRAHKNLAKFQGNAKFSTWLYRIAHNASIDLLRKRNRRDASNIDDFVDENRETAFDDQYLGAPLGFNPSQEFQRQEHRDAINRAFAALSPAHREILTLREVEGLPYQDIADILEIKIGTVMSRLHHARLNAQKYLKENFPELVEGAVPSGER